MTRSRRWGVRHAPGAGPDAGLSSVDPTGEGPSLVDPTGEGPSYEDMTGAGFEGQSFRAETRDGCHDPDTFRVERTRIWEIRMKVERTRIWDIRMRVERRTWEI